MNRKHHLAQTLPANIQDNQNYPACEFVILDYNSTDGLQDWYRQNLQNLGNRVKYYRTSEPGFYQRSHSRNMVMRLAKGEILCNLDADNFAGNGFADFIAGQFSKKPNILLTPEDSSLSDTFGKMVFRAEDFHRVRGYDEEIKSYGFEDNDLKERLRAVPLKEKHYLLPEFLKAISHTLEERILNEELTKTTRIILLKKIDYKTSEVILVTNQNKFLAGIIEDRLFSEQKSGAPVKPLKVLDRYQLTGSNFTEGQFDPGQFREYKEITGKTDRNNVIYFISQIKNKARFGQNLKLRTTVNPDGYGKGFVYDGDKILNLN